MHIVDVFRADQDGGQFFVFIADGQRMVASRDVAAQLGQHFLFLFFRNLERVEQKPRQPTLTEQRFDGFARKHAGVGRRVGVE